MGDFRVSGIPLSLRKKIYSHRRFENFESLRMDSTNYGQYVRLHHSASNIAKWGRGSQLNPEHLDSSCLPKDSL